MDTEKILEKFKDKTLLIVEDSKDIRELINSIFKKILKKVVVANDGIDGYKLAKELNPDIIISDYRMPNLNGGEMAKKIKEFNNIPIIMISAYTEEINNLDNIDKVFRKPIEFIKLLETMDKLVKDT